MRSGISMNKLVSIPETVNRQSHMYAKYPILKFAGILSLVIYLITPYWLASKYWDRIADLFSSKEQFIIVSLMVTGLTVHASTLVIYYIIYRAKLPIFEQFKDNDRPWPWEYDPEFRTKIKKALLLVGFNNLVCSPLFTYTGVYCGLLNTRVTKDELPSFPVFLTQIVFMILCEDISFYFLHRLLHQPALYPYIHKVHHQFYDTIAISSEYAHPIEFILSNAIPVGLGTMFLCGRAHQLSFLTFLTMRLIETVESHGGYDFPWAMTRPVPFSVSSKYHNHHHMKNIGNYGSWFVMWDAIFGTNSYYYNDLLENDDEFSDYQTADRKEK
jgi:sterol desaturase/sphingolipid hydroxylase (fatty acid hydroxylase superfamily)